MKKKNLQLVFCLLLSLCGYLYFGYVLRREYFLPLVSVYLVLFSTYIFLVRTGNEQTGKILFAAAIVFRLVFLFSIPALSDDYFRFIWDGKMMNIGVNPFSVIPFSFISDNHLSDYLLQLYTGMNSQAYYTVYPPVLQFMFAFAVWLFPDNLFGAVVILHACSIAAEIGTILLIPKLLKYFQLPKENVWWYALNPLVIIELSGNLHFESLVIFFLLLAIYLLIHNRNGVDSDENKIPLSKIAFSGISFALAISSKLIPLLFLPFFLRRLKWKQSILFFTTICIVCALLFLPFLDSQFIKNTGSSLNLYFQKFEFNAGIYYLIRWIGFRWKGYDVIQQTGPWLGAGVFILVVLMMISEKKLTLKNYFRMMQWALTIYLLLATNVHPWYIVLLIMMSVFTQKRFAIVWSLFIILSYSTYQVKPYQENLWWTVLEYGALITALAFDLIRDKKNPLLRRI